jgi:hypothetical protein
MEQKEVLNNKQTTWVTVKRTINFGNYENKVIEAGYSKTINEDDEPIELITEMELNLSDFVDGRVREIKRKRAKRRRKILNE